MHENPVITTPRILPLKYIQITLFLILIQISFFSFSHEYDDWQDSSEYVIGDSHRIITKHFETVEQAMQACRAHVASMGYGPDGYCRYISSDGAPMVEAGWLLYKNTTNFDLLMFFYDHYYLEIPKLETCSTAGNPCALASGVKTQNEVDYDANNLFFERNYSSNIHSSSILGNKWQHNYSLSLSENYAYVKNESSSNFSSKYSSKEFACMYGWASTKNTAYNGSFSNSSVVYEGGQCKVQVSIDSFIYLKIHSDNPYSNIENENSAIVLSRPDGKRYIFEQIGSVYHNPIDPRKKLRKEADHWVFSNSDGSQEIYNVSGQLIQLISRSGQSKTLDYNIVVADGGDGNPSTLDSVSNSYDQQLNFSYNDQNNLTQLSTPRGNIQYAYDTNNNLSNVIYEDNEQIQYVYNDLAFPNYLTGIIDQKGVQFATWQYDAQGRAILSEHAGGVESVSFEFMAQGRTKTTDVLGATRIYEFQVVEGAQRIKSIIGDPCINCNHSDYKSQAFTTDGLLSSRTDWNNITTLYEYTNHRLTQKTIAANTTEEKIINMTWDENLNLPTSTTEGTKKTNFSYDSNGLLITKTITDTALNLSRTTSYSYDHNGLLASINAPRNNTNDITTFEYDSQGRLHKTVNALGHTTEIVGYNASNLPLSIIHPNNAIEERTYTARGWLQSKTISGASTLYEYDPIGQLTKITQPNNATQALVYDDARRLTAIIDGDGNKTEYILDLAGNRLQTKTTAPDGSISYLEDQQYNKLSQLIKTIRGQNIENNYEYDLQGAIIKHTDGLSNITLYTNDALARLTEALDPNGGRTLYTYNGNNQITSVNDAEGNATHYTYNALSDLIQLNSPDTGITSYEYDSAGNRTQQTDAKGTVTQYTYDALNRMTSQTYPASPTENITYHYDDNTDGNKGIGRLTRIEDASGSTSYVYDERSNIIQKTRVINGETYTSHHTYDNNNNQLKTSYPSGRIINYQRDNLGRVQGISTQQDFLSAIEIVIENVRYQAFGLVTSLVYGNGLSLGITYDQGAQITAVTSEDTATTTQGIGLSYDLIGNIASIVDSLNTAQDQAFSYDSLHRLTQATGEYGNINYSYDGIGNRLTRTIANNKTTTEDYQYTSTGSQLSNIETLIDGTPHNRINTFDANGNIAEETRNDGNRTYVYDASNRLVSVTIGDTKNHYQHNALGQRVSKTGTTATPRMDYTTLAQQYEATAQIHNTAATTLLQQASDRQAQASNEASQSQTLHEQAQTANQQASDARLQAQGNDLQANALSSQAIDLRAQAIVNRQQADINDQQATELLQQVPLLRGQASQLRTEAAEYEPRIQRLQRRIDRNNATIATLEGQIVEHPQNRRDERRNARLQKRINKVIQRRERIQERLNPTLTQYSDLIGQAETLETQAEQNESNAANLQQNSTDLRLQADGDDNQANENDINATNLQQQAEALQAQADSLDAQATQLSASATSHQQQADDLNAQADELTQQAANEQQFAATAQAEADHYWALVASPPISLANVHYIYDLKGQLISENHLDDNQKNKDYLYLENTPIAMVSEDDLYFIHSDHLGTPRHVTDTTQKTVWEWISPPFGQQAANDDPDGDSVKFEMNLRFPGQYFDVETGLHYNYFRDYDPSTGRYITSDPIGLNGGLNTFGYVNGNPLNLTDPTGENPKLYAAGSFCLGLAIGDAINNAYPPDQYLRDALESINNNIEDLEGSCPMDSKGDRTRDLIDKYKRARLELIAQLSSNQGNTLMNTFIQNFSCAAAIGGLKLFP